MAGARSTRREGTAGVSNTGDIDEEIITCCTSTSGGPTHGSGNNEHIVAGSNAAPNT